MYLILEAINYYYYHYYYYYYYLHSILKKINYRVFF